MIFVTTPKKSSTLNTHAIEVDSTPSFANVKPVAILKSSEFAKLLTKLERMKEPWLALKFNDLIFIVWKELVFLHDHSTSVRGQKGVF